MDEIEYKLSVVLTVHNQADEVERNLPLLLCQRYDAGFEVIVVDEASIDETADVLKRLRAQHAHLYTTFIPKSVPNPCQQRLALTIGAKAAKYPWVVVADITRPPQSMKSLGWLADVIGSQQPGLVTAYSSRRENDMPRYQMWETVDQAAPLLRKAERRTGLGHRGRRLAIARGLYDAVAVPRASIHDALRHYDCDLRGRRLWAHRLAVLCKSFTNRAIRIE